MTKQTLILSSALVIISVYAFSVSQRLANVERRFGGAEKLKCNESALKEKLGESVFRVIGSLGEGSGFPISEYEILTNFHVVEGESSPKIVFPDGSFETVKQIRGSKNKDVAILTIERKLEPLSFFGYFGRAETPPEPVFGEPIYSAGYPLGSELKGDVTIKKGSFGGTRYFDDSDMSVIQTDISLNGGMSGGPLVNSCGQVLGVNTAGLSGLSIFLDMSSIQRSIGDYTTEEVTKINLDLTTQKGVVEAFYAYIKARDLKSAYNLLSKDRLASIVSYEEWEKGYNNTLHVEPLELKETDNKDTIFVKLLSQDWVVDELVVKYFEGTWEVINENGSYKLNKSNIKEIEDPDLDWFYPPEL